MLEVFYWSLFLLNFTLCLKLSLKAVKNKLFLPLSPLVQLFVFDSFFYLVHANYLNGIKVLSFQLLLILAFAVGLKYLSTKTLASSEENITSQKNKFNLYKLHFLFASVFMAGAGIIVYIFVSNGAGLSIFFDYEQFILFYALSRRSGAASFQLLVLTLLFATLLIAHISNSKIHYVFSFLFAGASSVLGGRGFIACFCLALFYSYFFNNRNKIKLIPIYIASVTTVIFIGLATSLRSKSIEHYFTEIADLDFNLLSILEDVEDANFLMDKPLLGSFNDLELLVPSFMAYNKPTSTYETIDLYPTVAAGSSNITFGLYPNAIFNLGYLGLIIPVLFYILLAKLFVSLQITRKPGSYTLFLFILLFAFQFQWLRGGLINIRFIPLFICLILAFATAKMTSKIANKI